MSSGYWLPDGHYVIFRTSKKLPNGTTIYAKDYGKKVFRIVLKDKPKDED